MIKAERRERRVQSRNKMGSSARNFYQLMKVRNTRLLEKEVIHNRLVRDKK